VNIKTYSTSGVIFNTVRPHEALPMKTPAGVYQKSEIKLIDEHLELRYGKDLKQDVLTTEDTLTGITNECLLKILLTVIMWI